MFKNWLKIAFNNYKKNLLSTTINVLGLSFGLCIFLLVFINWQDEKSYEDWIPNKENIYLVENTVGDFGTMVVSSYPELAESKELFPEIEDYTTANAWRGYSTLLMNGSKSVYTSPARVSPSFFSFFPMELVAGSYTNAVNDNNKMALSEETAKALYGKEYQKSIGKTVFLDSDKKERYVITAIYKLPKGNSVFKPGFVMRHRDLTGYDSNWTNYSFVGYLKLKPGTNVGLLENKISEKLAAEEKKMTIKYGEKYDETKKAKVHLTPLSTMKLDALSEGVDKGDKKSIMIMLGLSIVIMILSAINFINLKTAQAAQRAKEVGVRKSMGASVANLMLQFWIETFLLCLLAYVVAFGIIEFLLPYYNTYLGKEIVLNYSSLLFYSGLILIVYSIFTGIIPALYLSKFKPINTLKGNFSRSKHGIWLRNGILTIQLIISSFFIICSIIIYAQVRYMTNKDLGFKGDQVMSIQFKDVKWEDHFTYKKNQRLKAEMSGILGVKDITSSVFEIGGGLRNSSNVKSVEDTMKVIPNVGCGGTDYNFFEFYQMKLIAGRNINPKLASDTANATIANESFIKKMGWSKEQAIGKEVYPGWEENKKKYKIIGVLKDFYINGVNQEVQPLLFFNADRNWSKDNLGNLQIKINANDIEGTVARIKEFWLTKAEPGYPFDYDFVDKKFAKTFEKFERQKTLFTILNIVVLSVALLGLFALSSLLIEQKLKDIAIKKTLGADEKTIVWDLTKKFLLMSLIAVLISFPLAYYAMNEWLKDFADRIEMPWWPYLLSLVILLVLTGLVVSIKAIRVTKINLVQYLKYE